jgi:hypothetical protein
VNAKGLRQVDAAARTEVVAGPAQNAALRSDVARAPIPAPRPAEQGTARVAPMDIGVERDSRPSRGAGTFEDPLIRPTGPRVAHGGIAPRRVRTVVIDHRAAPLYGASSNPGAGLTRPPRRRWDS